MIKNFQKKLQEVIEREEREGRVIGGEETNDMQRRRQELQQRMDIDDTDIVIQGSTTTRLSRKQVFVLFICWLIWVVLFYLIYLFIYYNG